jgi:hypothetical protein
MIKYSEKFMKGIDDALAWCDAEDKRIAEEEAVEAEKKRRFHYSFLMAIIPVVIQCKINYNRI